MQALRPAVSADTVREVTAIADAIAKSGGTPLAVAKDNKLLGIIHLKDIVKGGIRERFAELRRMGIRTIMITGDNPDDRGSDRSGSRRRRLPRASHARGQVASSSATSSRKASWSRCAATAPTTRRHSPRPMSASR